MTPTQRKAVLCGLALLFAESYLDNIRGPLLPVLRDVLGLSHTRASWFLIGGNFASVLATFALIPLTRHYNDRSITMGIAIVAVLTATLAPLVNSGLSLTFLGISLGAIVAMAGAMSNLWVFHGTSLQDRGRFLCSLHMMYGFGSLVGPLSAGDFQSLGRAWYLGLLVSIPAFLSLGLSLFFFYSPKEGHSEAVSMAFRPRLPQWLAILAFTAYATGETLLSTWLSSYLIEARGLTHLQSTYYVCGFFLVMGLTRAVCFFSTVSIERYLLWGSLFLGCGLFLIGRAGWLPAFCLAGILGPYFPLFLARTSRVFPEEARPLTLAILTAMQLSLAFCHLTVGELSDRIGIAAAYWLPFILIVVGMAMVFLFELVISLPPESRGFRP